MSLARGSTEGWSLSGKCCICERACASVNVHAHGRWLYCFFHTHTNTTQQTIRKPVLSYRTSDALKNPDKLKDMENQVKEKDATIRLLRLQLASEHDREVRFDDDVITGTGEATSTAAGTGHGNAIHDSLSRCMDLQRDSMSDNAGQPDVKGSPIPASELAMKSSIPGAENAMSTEEVHHLEKSVNQLHNCTAAMPYEFHLVQTEVHSHSDQDNDSNTTRGSLPLDVVRVQKQLDETQQHLTSRLNDTKQQLAGANILLTEKGRMIESLEHERDIEQNRVDEIEEQLADANMLLADKSRMLESMLQQRAIESPVISPSEDVSSSLIAPLCAENASIISVLREMLDVTKSMVEAAEESKLVETFHTNTDLGRRNNMCGTDGFEISSSGLQKLAQKSVIMTCSHRLKQQI